MKANSRVNLDKTLAFTQSSFFYKDPFNPKGGLLYKAKNKVQTFFSLRNVENEFIDFKTFHVDTQFREIYHDLFNAYRRNDKVVLHRSLSESMFEVRKRNEAYLINIVLQESAERQKGKPILQDY